MEHERRNRPKQEAYPSSALYGNSSPSIAPNEQKAQGPIRAHYGKQAPCQASTNAIPMPALDVEAHSLASAQWFWCNERRGALEMLDTARTRDKNLERWRVDLGGVGEYTCSQTQCQRPRSPRTPPQAAGSRE